MRIINSVLGDATGGRWQVVCDYSDVLQKQGHQVLMLLNDTLPDTLTGIPVGVEVQRIRSHGHYDWPAAWRLGRRLRTRPPAIALAHCSRSVALLKRALGRTAPVLAVTHSTRVKRLGRADAVIALTHALREKILADPASRQLPVYVVPNHIDVLPGSSPASHPLQQPPVIGALGRFDPAKGFDIFIDALGQLAEQGVTFQARLAGAGKEEGRLREQIRVRGLAGCMDLSGWIPPASVDRFLSGLDLLCVPARSDAFGLTPLQGAAAGVPLLLSRASGHRAMFDEDTEALFFDRDDATALASQIQRFLSDPAGQKQRPSAAFERILRDYSEVAVTKGIRSAIDNTLISFNKR